MLKLTALHHVTVGVPDVAATERFATDFGLVAASRLDDGRVFMRTAGSAAFSYVIEHATAPTLRAIGFSVESDADLRQAVAEHGATPVDTGSWPGGGKAVALKDPDGTTVILVTGNAQVEPVYKEPLLPVNTGQLKVRKGEAQRVPRPGPPQLMRLGHVAIVAGDFDRTVAWYERVLGLLPTDLMYMGDKSHLVAGFHRLNRGEHWTDHHTVAFFRGEVPQFHHISFEMQDMAQQYAAHRWMTGRGWDSIWGVGRHPLGSHVFDLWRDPNRFRFETFTDTDLLTADRPPKMHEITTQRIDLWTDRSHETYFS